MAVPVTVENTTGWTRDLSAAGVFFTCTDRAARPPDVGTQIRLGLVLDHADPRGSLEVRFEGSVVRVDRSADAVGIAVQFDSYQFEPAGSAASASRT